MATVERVIPPSLADDGSVHYSSVTSPSDDSIAVCHMVSDRVIPVIFVPGVMGTNLQTTDDPSTPVWLVNGAASVVMAWGMRGASKRKLGLNPARTDVYGGGAIAQGTVQTDVELRRRGWGEVANMSYGTFLPWLENALNDVNTCKTGWRAELMKNMADRVPGISPLSQEEVALSYKYQFPVHAVGYNWLQSNKRSANRLKSKIDEFIQHYRNQHKKCEYVILITHSMGGLVSRWYSENLGGKGNILGIVHGVMPATGSATAYKRVKSGTEMPSGIALGSNAAEMTAVFSQSPGPLQLLPSPEYGLGWLKIRGGSESESLPRTNPYEEIYLSRGQPQGYLAAYRLMRCVRWDTLTEVPPHEVSGKTRLVAPRAELRANLKRLLLQKQWPELLERVEAAFAEGANHFWLDLQYYAFSAQEQAGGQYAPIRERVATDCALMLERLPGLEHLAFSDGSPFADDATLEWIARYATVRDIERGETVVPVSGSSTHTVWAETEAQAADLAAQQGLEAAFAWLQRVPAQDGERDRFVRQLVMARVAERAERQDTALHLLSTLDVAAQRFQLAAWEPSLAFESKYHLLRLLKLRMSRKDADKAALARRIDALVGELTAIDPARAVTLA